MRVWQHMLSGRRLDLVNPSAMDIEIEDIAHGLSRVSRWNGQTTGDHALSVAQHSPLVEQVARILKPGAPDAWHLVALLHDAAEYVTGDMTAPFRNAAGADAFAAFEERLMQVIHVRFGLPAVLPPQLKRLVGRADRAAAYLEAVQVAGFSPAESRRCFGPPPVTVQDVLIRPLPAAEAKRLFTGRFSELLACIDAAAA